MHCTGPVTVGNGGEMAIGTKAMGPFVDTVRERPDMLAIDASRQRMELADKADVLTLGLDAAATIKAENSLEKMLAHQMAAAHTAAMEAQAEALDLLQSLQAHRLHSPASQHRGRADDERLGADDGHLPARHADDRQGPQRRDSRPSSCSTSTSATAVGRWSPAR